MGEVVYGDMIDGLRASVDGEAHYLFRGKDYRNGRSLKAMAWRLGRELNRPCMWYERGGVTAICFTDPKSPTMPNWPEVKKNVDGLARELMKG